LIELGAARQHEKRNGCHDLAKFTWGNRCRNPFPISLSKDYNMNTMLSLGGAMPLLREVDGFMSFSKLNKADGILRTGIQTLVGNQRGVQHAVRQLAEVLSRAALTQSVTMPGNTPDKNC
jgi:hypothetical protein